VLQGTHGESERGFQPERNSDLSAEEFLQLRARAVSGSQTSPGEHRGAKHPPPGQYDVVQHLGIT